MPKQSGSESWLNWLLVSVVAVPSLLYAFVAWEDRTSTLRQAEQRARDITAIFEQHARNVLETQQIIGNLVNERVRGMSWADIATARDLHNDLRRIVENFPQVQSIWLVDANGIARSSSRSFPQAPIDVSDRDYFNALRSRNSGVFIGQVITGRVSANNIFNMARRRASPDGSFDGVIVVSALPSYFVAFWSRNSASGLTSTSLVRTDGAILARNPESAADRVKTDNLLMQAIAQGGLELFTATSGIDGVERIYTYRVLAGFPVVISHGIAVADVLALWRVHLVSYGIFFLLATISLAALALMVRRRVRHETMANRVAARFHGFLQAAPDPMIVVRQDGLISFANDRACRAFGYTDGELRELSIDRLVAEGQRIAHRDLRRNYSKTSEARMMGAGLDVMGRRKDGALFPVEVGLSPLEIDDENLVIALIRDITQRKRLEADLEESRAQIVASTRLSALGTMAGGIAHEINNPLGVCPGNGLPALQKGRVRWSHDRTSSCGELREVVGGADQRPFAGDLLDAA